MTPYQHHSTPPPEGTNHPVSLTQRRPAGIPSPQVVLGVQDLRMGLTELIRPYRARRGDPCPLCGSTSECFALPDPQRADVRHVYCTRGAYYPGALQWDGFGFKGSIWYLPFTGDAAMPRRAAATKRPTFQPAPLEVQDRVLRKIARHFGLSAEHRAHLAARGYDPERCGPDDPYLFASLPANPALRARVIIELLAHSETWQDLQGIYGMAYDRRLTDSPLYFLPRVTGAALIEFTQDANGLVWGFQYAPDVPEVDAKGKAKKRLSADGMTIAEHYHCTLPPSERAATLWHTEGIHKAHLVSAHYGVAAVAALGVGNARGLIAAAHDLDPDAQRLHVVALDSDMWGNKDGPLAQALHEAGYRVALARWDGAAAKGPDDALLAGLPITCTPYEPEGQRRTLLSLAHAYPWQRSQETQAQIHARLAAVGDQMQRDVVAHINSNSPAVQVIIGPPGVGKSTAVARIAQHRNLAWIAQRHDMVGSNRNLDEPIFRHILTATDQTCPEGWQLHRALVTKGYQTAPAHEHATGTCAFGQQWDMQWPSIYQMPHLATPFPAGHDAIGVDECDVASWLAVRPITVSDLHATNNKYVAGSTTSQFLSDLQLVLTDIGQQHHADPTAPLPSGAAVFDAIAARCHGQLTVLLAQMEKAFPLRPHPPMDITLDNPQAVDRAEHLPLVVLPQLVAALLAELPRWQRGQPFNSRIRIGPVGDGMAFQLTEPRSFTPNEDGHMPPRFLLDATADPTLLSRLWNAPVTVKHYEVQPPPHMRHIAVRTGKRYGKISLTAHSHDKDRARVVAEVRYLLRDLDPDGTKLAAGLVGLVTYQDCKTAIGEALGIPDHRRLHFWATRGSNALEKCEILLVIGTPALDDIQVVRLAEALYWREAKIDPRYEKDEDGHHRYRDPRCQALADYLINAELTQCAHRNRPLRHDGRVVVTMCQGEIDYLPATTTITNLPQLTDDGEERRTKRLAEAEQQIQAAIAQLQHTRQPVTTRVVARLTHIQISLVSTIMRRLRYREVSIARAFPVSLLTITAKRETLLRMAPLPPTAPLIGPCTPSTIPFVTRMGHWIDAGLAEEDAIRAVLIERGALAEVS